MRIQRKNTPARVEIFTGTIADITFLLVVFFVVTSILSATRGLGYHPDTEDDVQVVEPKASIDVHVMADGSLQVDRRPMSLAQLGPYLAAHLRQNPSKPVILRTDVEASYGSMVEVLDELNAAPQRLGFEIQTLAIPTAREMQQNWVDQAFQN